MNIFRKLTTVLQLWFLGVLESLQLHRCVVLFVLDSSRDLWARVWRCFFLNGCLFLGSILWWSLALGPATHWLISRLAAPCWGPGWARLAEQALGFAFDALLLLPMYATTMLASSMECQSVAKAAFAVQQQRQASAADGAAACAKPASPLMAASSSAARAANQSTRPGSSGLETVAQELYRVLLLSVYYVQSWCLGKIPYVGPPLYMVSMTWLWAYYCYDYKWSLQGVHLADRIAYFETHWAFFSGFGAIMSAATILLPFYWGAVTSAVLFPLFIIVACDSDPDTVHARVIKAMEVRGPASGRAGAAAVSSPGPVWGQIPIFYLALCPCHHMFGALTSK